MAWRFLLLLFCLYSECIFAQQVVKANYQLAKKFENISLKGVVNKNSLSIYPRFINGTDKFWFNFRTEKGMEYYFVDPEKKEKKYLFDNSQLASQLASFSRKACNEKELYIYDLTFSDDFNSFSFKYDGNVYSYNRVNGKVCKAENKPSDSMDVYSYMTFSPDGKNILYSKNHNLFMCKSGDSTGEEDIQLTFDGVEGYSYASEEADSNRKVKTDAAWCPDSRYIYIVRTDVRKVEKIGLVSSQMEHPMAYEYSYEMPGDKYLAQYELWIIDSHTRQVKKIQLEKWQDQYIKVLEVSSDSKKIYLERNKRTWDEVDICVVDIETGKVHELINELDKPYRDVNMANIKILNKGKDILFRSVRSGWGHYYHYVDGALKNTVTSGSWTVGSIVHIDTLKRCFYFYGFGREKNIDPYYYLLYKGFFDKEEVTLITSENAHHDVVISPSGKYFIDIFSRVDKKPTICLKEISGKVLMELVEPDIRRLLEMGWRFPERFSVKAADGVTDLYGIMWKPADFDSTRKYPIISYVYPGPYYEFVQTSFSIDDAYNTRLAQLGFIVIVVGHRGGSPIRGKFYQQYGYGNLRDYPLADDKYAIEQLADRYSYIDISKVGILGHSGGGAMAAAAICTYPDFYTAAVASAGNHDNRIYNRGWVEIYHGVREYKSKDDSSYRYVCKAPSSLGLVGNLKGHLLLVSGDMDSNVHPAHTLRMADALIKAGKNFDLLILPGADHGFGGEKGAFFERKLWHHFAKYLLGDYRENFE